MRPVARSHSVDNPLPAQAVVEHGLIELLPRRNMTVQVEVAQYMVTATSLVLETS